MKKIAEILGMPGDNREDVGDKQPSPAAGDGTPE